MCKLDDNSLRLGAGGKHWDRTCYRSAISDDTDMQGALAGMLTGGVMVFVWKYLVRPLGGNFNIYELLPAFVLSCLAIVKRRFII